VNTTEFLEISCAICPDRDLMVFDGQRWSFSQTSARVNRLARVLRDFGVTRGDRVGMLQVNCNQYVETYFATAKVGAIFVPLNFRAKSEELKYMITHAGIKVLFTAKRYLKMIEALLEQMPDVQQCICLEKVQGQRLYYEDLLSSSSSEEISLEIDEEEITILMYTSGTTGRPKGVPLKHSGFISYIMENVEPANPEIEERNLLTVPLYHIAGMQATDRLQFSAFINLQDAGSGLDQIAGSGTAYRILVDNLLSNLRSRTIIASRPFAVLDWVI